MLFFTHLPSIQSHHQSQIFDLFIAAFMPQKRHSSKHLCDYFESKIAPRLQRDTVYVAQDGDQIVGFAIFEAWNKDTYYLAEMAVSPSYQGRGIGSTLVFSILDKDPSLKTLLLVTEDQNKGAKDFYEAIGFSPSSFVHPDYPKGFVGYEFHGKG